MFPLGTAEEETEKTWGEREMRQWRGICSKREAESENSKQTPIRQFQCPKREIGWSLVLWTLVLRILSFFIASWSISLLNLSFNICDESFTMSDSPFPLPTE
jgi:hypothetical protein